MAEARRKLPVKIEVEVDLREVMLPGFKGYDEDGDPIQVPRTVEEALFETAAHQIANMAIADAKGKDGWYDALRERAKRILDEALAAQATDMVEEALASTFQPVNTFGEPTGKGKTFREYVADRITKWLQERDPSSSSYNNPTTRIEAILRKLIDRTFEREIAAEVQKGKQQALAALRDKSAALMAKALGDLAEEEKRNG